MMHTSHNLLRFLIKTIGGNRLSDQWTRPDCVRGETYLDALLLVRALRLQIGLVFVSPLHTQEAVCCVADAAGQHAVPQHGVHHRAFTVTGPGEHLWFKKKKKKKLWIVTRHNAYIWNFFNEYKSFETHSSFAVYFTAIQPCEKFPARSK